MFSVEKPSGQMVPKTPMHMGCPKITSKSLWVSVIVLSLFAGLSSAIYSGDNSKTVFPLGGKEIAVLLICKAVIAFIVCQIFGWPSKTKSNASIVEVKEPAEQTVRIETVAPERLEERKSYDTALTELITSFAEEEGLMLWSVEAKGDIRVALFCQKMVGQKEGLSLYKKYSDALIQKFEQSVELHGCVGDEKFFREHLQIHLHFVDDEGRPFNRGLNCIYKDHGRLIAYPLPVEKRPTLQPERRQKTATEKQGGSFSKMWGSNYKFNNYGRNYSK